MTPQEVIDLFWKHIESADAGSSWSLATVGWVAENVVVAYFSHEMSAAIFYIVTEEGLEGFRVPAPGMLGRKQKYDQKNPLPYIEKRRRLK